MGRHSSREVRERISCGPSKSPQPTLRPSRNKTATPPPNATNAGFRKHTYREPASPRVARPGEVCPCAYRPGSLSGWGGGREAGGRGIPSKITSQSSACPPHPPAPAPRTRDTHTSRRHAAAASRLGRRRRRRGDSLRNAHILPACSGYEPFEIQYPKISHRIFLKSVVRLEAFLSTFMQGSGKGRPLALSISGRV